MASKISRGFAELGVGVVSGMARGIDRAALEGSIEAGGRAIAILGSGIDIVYPPENRDLYMSLCNHGLILSQFLPGKDPEAYNFPNRNRIISGLCPGVVIVQAGKKSGAMITAQTAINENREVFVVPAPLGSFGFEGSNTLIDYGAKPVNTALEVIEEIKNFSVSKPKIRISKTKEISKDILHSSSELPLPEPSLPTDILPNEKKSILKALSKPQHIDYISEVTGISMSALHLLLIELMLDDYITEQPGKIFIRIK